MQNKLLPCPFCNGIANLTSKDKVWDAQLYRATWVECEVCHAKTREVWNTTYNDRPNDREKEVIEKWNRRKPMERIVEQLSAEIEKADKRAINEASVNGHSLDYECFYGQRMAYINARQIVKGGVDNAE